MRKGDNEEEERIYRRPSEGSEEMFPEDEVAFNNVYNQLANDDAAQPNERESIYSHQTSEILDEEKVSFMHIGGMPEDA